MDGYPHGCPVCEVEKASAQKFNLEAAGDGRYQQLNEQSENKIKSSFICLPWTGKPLQTGSKHGLPAQGILFQVCCS